MQNEEKRAYVDGRKVEVDGCAVCYMKVITDIEEWWPGHNGLPHCFDFAHLDDQIKGDEDGNHGNVAKLVARGCTLKRVKADLDREMDPSRSRVLCKCRHAVETKKRSKEFEAL